MRKISLSLFFVSVFFLGICSTANAVAVLTLAEKEIAAIKAFTQDGVAYINKYGTKNAYAEINKVNGKLRKGSYYLFVYNYDGQCLAHGDDPGQYVGTNLFKAKDTNGALFMNGMVKLAKSGGGFVQYTWPNAKTGKEELKTSYIMPAGNNTLVGAGISNSRELPQ